MAKKKAVKVLRKQKKRETLRRFTQKQNIGRACLTAQEFRLLQRMSHSSKALQKCWVVHDETKLFEPQ